MGLSAPVNNNAAPASDMSEAPKDVSETCAGDLPLLLRYVSTLLRQWETSRNQPGWLVQL